jgi:hypothetical protein
MEGFQISLLTHPVPKTFFFPATLQTEHFLTYSNKQMTTGKRNDVGAQQQMFASDSHDTRQNHNINIEQSV